MDDEWSKHKRELETAAKVSMRLQEKAYFMSTLALMEIAEQLTVIAASMPVIVASMPNPLDRPE